MKQKPGMITRKIGDEYIIIPTEGENVNHILTLNISGGFVWQLLEEEHTFEDIVTELSKEFDITHEQATEDLKEFIEQIRSYIYIDE